MGVIQLSTNGMHSPPLLPLHVSHLPNFWNVSSGVRQLQPRTNIFPITLPYQLVTSHPMSQGWLLQPETLEPWDAIFVPPAHTKPLTNMPPTDSKSVSPDPREINIHAFEELQRLCKEIQQICEAKHPTNRKDDETQNSDRLSEQSTHSHASDSTPTDVTRVDISKSDSLAAPEIQPSDQPSIPSEGGNHLDDSNGGGFTALLPTKKVRQTTTKRHRASWHMDMPNSDSLFWGISNNSCCSTDSSDHSSTAIAVQAHQDSPSLLKPKNPHNSEACACCTQALDLDEAAAAIKASDPSSIHSEGSDHLGASDGGVIAVAGIVALFTLTGAYRVFNQSRNLIPSLRQKITQASHPMRIQQLKRSLNNAYVNLGATIVNVATMGGMLAGLAVAAATPIGWGLLIGYAGIQAMRHLYLVIRTHQDMAHHSQAHEIAKTDYTARKHAYLGISASFTCQGIGAILIIAGLASGFGAPLAIAGLICVLAGSGGSLWLNNRYPPAYAPRNESHWGIDRDALTKETRAELLNVLKKCKTTLKEAYNKSDTTIKWKKKMLRILGAFPMTSSMQKTLEDWRNTLNQSRDEALNRLDDELKQPWLEANKELAALIQTITKPDQRGHSCRHGCTHQRVVDIYPLSEIRYMLRALCDDEMTTPVQHPINKN